ncbi:hypothetical protein [Longimicrobium terrae]|uniref:Ig-like domain-containing protein n=1 Tax=Longimicrobium terrae TaxID=1639882 RepID=A0A841GQY6_9BACT|nr:hypothetical protein [Longimicrobium terrae]MBB4635086.1 hypothetical protein [Longimicrobium terrae]MBB6069480.1 hypothetical protein [Longimicrobium terrae]NNC31717.1 hypothetical protein [Longimicrobium terrae]
MKIARFLACIALAATAAGACESTTAASRAAPAGPQRDLDPLEVEILGQSPILPNTNCEFWASATGGGGTYTYTWTKTSPAIGTPSGAYWTGRSSASFSLRVSVTDGVSTAADTIAVTVSSSAPFCPV